MARKTGRPTKYSQEILDVALDYLENFEQYGDAVPSQIGLASELGIAISTLHKWKKEPEKEEFSYMLERIKARQEKILLTKGLSGEFNSNIVKLMLAKHGYSNKHFIKRV
jgi:hypothetical protein